MAYVDGFVTPVPKMTGARPSLTGAPPTIDSTPDSHTWVRGLSVPVRSPS